MNEPETTPSEVKSSGRGRLWAGWAIVCSLLILCAVFVPAIVAVRRSFLSARTHGETQMITAAIRAYYDEFGTVPSGTPGELMKAIRGANPKNLVFFVFEPKRFSSSGEFLDAWGTPYQIDVSDPTHPKVHSIGPNRTDEHGQHGSDDIVNWR
jgi:hypothetical protein